MPEQVVLARSRPVPSKAKATIRQHDSWKLDAPGALISSLGYSPAKVQDRTGMTVGPATAVCSTRAKEMMLPIWAWWFSFLQAYPQEEQWWR